MWIIDSVRKDDEHKAMLRLSDNEGGIILVSVAMVEDGVNVLLVDSNVKHLTRIRVGVGNSDFVTHVPLVAST